MDLSGRIIIIFILTVLSIYLLNLSEPVHDFLSSILTMPPLRHNRNQALYHLAKLCILLIAAVGIVKILSRR